MKLILAILVVLLLVMGTILVLNAFFSGRRTERRRQVREMLAQQEKKKREDELTARINQATHAYDASSRPDKSDFRSSLQQHLGEPPSALRLV